MHALALARSAYLNQSRRDVTSCDVTSSSVHLGWSACHAKWSACIIIMLGIASGSHLVDTIMMDSFVTDGWSIGGTVADSCKRRFRTNHSLSGRASLAKYARSVSAMDCHGIKLWWTKVECLQFSNMVVADGWKWNAHCWWSQRGNLRDTYITLIYQWVNETVTPEPFIWRK